MLNKKLLLLVALFVSINAQAYYLKNLSYENPFNQLEKCKTGWSKERLLQIAQKTESLYRIEAICELGAQKIPEAYDKLISILKSDDDPYVRAAAVIAAANYARPGFVPIALDRLFNEMDVEEFHVPASHVSRNLGWAIGLYGSDRYVDELLKQIKEDSENSGADEGREGAIVALGLFADRGILTKPLRHRVGKFLQDRLLVETDLASFKATVETLGSLRYSPATLILAKLLMGEVDSNVKYYTAENSHFTFLGAFEQFRDPIVIAPTKKWMEKLLTDYSEEDLWSAPNSLNYPICRVLHAANDPVFPKGCRKLYKGLSTSLP